MSSHRPAPHAVPGGITLRDVQAADLPVLFAFESDPAWGVMAMVKPRSWAAFEAVWARIIREREAGASDGGPAVAQRAILVDGELCGSIGLHLRDGRRRVGYGLGRAFWGRGIASRALGLFLAEGGPGAQRPLYATAAASNIASIRVLMKHGFVIVERQISAETERYLACEEVSLVLA